MFGYDKWSRMPKWIDIPREVVLWASLVGLARVWRAERRGSGAAVSMPQNHTWRVRDGLVVEVRAYPTLDAALDAVTLAS